MKHTAFILISHGSREKGANQSFLALVERFRKAKAGRMAEPAFLELSKPDLAESVSRCAEAGAREIMVLPVMLFSGRHVKEHIPALIEAAKAKYPHVDFHYGPPLGEQEEILNLIEGNIEKIRGRK